MFQLLIRFQPVVDVQLQDFHILRKVEKRAREKLGHQHPNASKKHSKDNSDDKRMPINPNTAINRLPMLSRLLIDVASFHVTSAS